MSVSHPYSPASDRRIIITPPHNNNNNETPTPRRVYEFTARPSSSLTNTRFLSCIHTAEELAMLRTSMRHAGRRFVPNTFVPTSPKRTRPTSNTSSYLNIAPSQIKLSRRFSSMGKVTVTTDDQGPTRSLTTNKLPSSLSSRLGSLSDEGWEDALATLFRHVQRAQENPEGSIYWMNKADKLLGRLQAEYVTKSTASRTRGDDILDGQLRILQGWSGLGRENPTLRLAGERGTQLFWNIIQRSKKPWWITTQDDDPRRLVLSHSFLDLLESYARRDFLPEKDIDQSTRLLLWNDLPAMPFDSSELGPMYAILMQQVEMAQDNKLLSQLEKQWKQISDEEISQWYLQVANEEDADEQLVDFDANTKPEKKLPRSLSSFESERMVKETVTLLESTEPKDRERIEKVIGQWESLISTGATQPKAVANVILDYYARSGDTSNAIKWLSRLDISNPDDMPKGLNHLLISLAEKDDPSAIWRAEEILRQLEASGGGNSLDSAAYAAVAERWLKTNESQAHRRVMELCFRPDKFDAKLVSVLLRGLRREKDVSAEMVNQLLGWFTSQNSSINSESRQDLLEGLLFVLQRHGKGWQGWEFFRSELENGAVVDDRLVELVVASVPASAHPDQVIEIFHYLESKNVNLDIGFFLEASKRVADLHQKERLDQLILLTRGVLQRLSTGTIDEKNPTLAFFFRSIFELVNYWKRDDISYELIELIEKSMSTKLPLSCYSSTANTLSWKGNLPGVQSIYYKLKDLYRAGHDNLHPDANLYLSYVRVLSLASTVDHSKLGSVFKEQLSLLEELKARFKSTGDAQYKPSPGMYKTLLSTITKMEPTEENAAKAESLLDDMISLEAFDTEDSDPFTITMHMILQSPKTNEYESIMEIRKKMEECGIKNSELVFVNTLRACTRSKGNEQRKDALERTLESLVHFRRHIEGNHSPNGARIYSLALVSSFRNLKDRDNRTYPIVRQIFRSCCEDGYVTPRIVKQVHGNQNLSKSFLHEIYGSHLLYGGHEPPEWSRNISSEQDRSSQ